MRFICWECGNFSNEEGACDAFCNSCGLRMHEFNEEEEWDQQCEEEGMALEIELENQ